MIKLILAGLQEYYTKKLKRYRSSDEEHTVVIYEVTNKAGVTLTRIDIYRVVDK